MCTKQLKTADFGEREILLFFDCNLDVVPMRAEGTRFFGGVLEAN